MPQSAKTAIIFAILNSIDRKNPRKAALLLFLATVFWGTTFILTKALGDLQRRGDPQAGSGLLSALSLTIRFGLGSLIVGLWQRARLRNLTWIEFTHGLGLGLFGGVGLLLQMDGVMHTNASTCAFLTQSYCIFIPAFLVWRHRQFPAATLAIVWAMVLAGIAVLANVDWRSFHIGLGELETIAGSIFFTAQILWLERPAFSLNDSGRVTVIMFAVSTVTLLPAVMRSSGGMARGAALYNSPAAIVIILFLTLACTVFTYVIMNEWQPHLSATEAGVIYCCEPVFTSAFALFLPGWISRWTGIAYGNERLTARLLLGGGLIMAANLLIQLPQKKDRP